MFATPGAVASLDAEDSAFTLTFSEDATIAAGGGALTVPSVSVAQGVSAAIDAPTAGAMTKTGAGTLTLGASRAEQTTVAEGTLAMSNGATISAANLTLGVDPETPVTFDYGGGTLSAAPASLMVAGCDVTLANGTFGGANQAFALTTGTLRFGSGSTLAPVTTFTLANAANATATVHKAAGDWNFSGDAKIATASGSFGTFRHSGGTLVLNGYTSVGVDGSGHTGIGNLVIDGGLVTNAAYYIEVGSDSPGVMTVKPGGRHVNVRDTSIGFLLSNRTGGTGTLNLEGGEVFIGGSFHMCYRTVSGAAAANVTDGGVLTFRNLVYNSNNGGRAAANATLTLDNGTIRAYSDNESFIPNYTRLTVSVGTGGGAIDANGKAVTIAKQLTGAGAMTYKGGGRVTLSTMPAYSGKTTVEVGTSLIVPSAIAGANLAIAIPDGLQPGVYEVVTISGSGTFAADVLSSASLPSSPDTRFVIGAGGKAIYCVYGSGVNEQVWIGGASGSLDVAANWLSGSVPTSGEAIIASALPATLTNPSGSTFAPTSITFPVNTSLVTITGEGTLSGLTAIVNNSSQHHVFNCPVVCADGITPNLSLALGESNYIVFDGGIALSAMPDVAAMQLAGAWNLTGGWDTPPSGAAVKSGATVDVSGTLRNGYSLSIEANATLRVGSVVVDQGTGGKNRVLAQNDGTFIVAGEILDEIVSSGNTAYSIAGFFTGGSGNAVTRANGLVHSGSTQGSHQFRLNHSGDSVTNTIVLGSGGLSFLGNQRTNSNCYPYFHVDSGKAVVLASSADWEIPNNTFKANGVTLELQGGAVIDTTDYDDHTVVHTVRVTGRIGNSGPTTVTGGGRMSLEYAGSSLAGGLHVQDTATVAVNVGCAPSGATSVADGATLEVAQSGTVALKNSLTLADGAALGFNFTDKSTPVLDMTGRTVTFGNESNVVVKVSAAEGRRAKSGENVLTAGGKFAGVNVTLAEGAPDWVKGVSVNEDGNIVLEASPSGFIVIVR